MGNAMSAGNITLNLNAKDLFIVKRKNAIMLLTGKIHLSFKEFTYSRHDCDSKKRKRSLFPFLTPLTKPCYPIRALFFYPYKRNNQINNNIHRGDGCADGCFKQN